MSVTEIDRQLEALPLPERTEVIKRALVKLCPQNRMVIERLIRRLENPDIPEDVWRGIEDAEDGRFVDMGTALPQPPPWLK